MCRRWSFSLIVISLFFLAFPPSRTLGCAADPMPNTSSDSSGTRVLNVKNLQDATNKGGDTAMRKRLFLSLSEQCDCLDKTSNRSSVTHSNTMENVNGNARHSGVTKKRARYLCHDRRDHFRRSFLRGGDINDDDPDDDNSQSDQKIGITSRSDEEKETSDIASEDEIMNITRIDANEAEVSEQGVPSVRDEIASVISSSNSTKINNFARARTSSSSNSSSTLLERMTERVQRRTNNIKNKLGNTTSSVIRKRKGRGNETNSKRRKYSYSIVKSRKRMNIDDDNNNDEDSSAEFWFNLPSFFRMGNVFQDIYELGIGADSNTTASANNRSRIGRNKTEADDISLFSSLFMGRGISNATVKGTSKRQLFLDWIAIVSERLVKIDSADVADDERSEQYSDEITEQSDLTRPGRTFHIVTTAALPWMTGTSVNPLLRAAYLCRMTKKINNEESNKVSSDSEKRKMPKHYVTLVVPWLELEDDRLELYGSSHQFNSPKDQEQYIRNWMRQQAGLIEEADPRDGIKILFYNARYHHGLKSIFAMGDICSIIVKDSEQNKEDVDVCILEEPEHLNWYRAPGTGWTKTFKYVVGIMHTNYKEYAAGHYSGLWTSPAIGIMSSAMVRAYCHKVVKLSDTLQTYAPEKEQVSNVHGVRQDFLKEGQRRALESTENEIVAKDKTTADSVAEDNGTSGEVYFIGKILWAKGFDKLIDLEDYFRQCTGEYFTIDIYGNGPDEEDIKRAFAGRNWKIHLSSTEDDEDEEDEDDEDEINDANEDDENIINGEEALEAGSLVTKASLDSSASWAQQKFETLSRKLKTATEKRSYELKRSIPKSRFEVLRQNPIPASFKGRIDHSILTEQYKIFVNPSVSEVLCTTTAEALAMGKFAIIPIHPSNEFFLKFPNCLAYRNKLEFAANLKWALTHEPEPLSPELSYEFTWEAATERFVKAAAITRREAHMRHKLRRSKLDERIAYFHNELGKGVKGDALRRVLGGGPISHQVKYSMEQKENNRELIENQEEDAPPLTSSSSLSLQST